MDARKMKTKVIKEGISRGNYKITGILETGEITIAILSDMEIKALNLLDTREQVNKFISIKGRPANEILQAYEQEKVAYIKRCQRNNLRLR